MTLLLTLIIMVVCFTLKTSQRIMRFNILVFDGDQCHFPEAAIVIALAAESIFLVLGHFENTIRMLLIFIHQQAI